jgi:hypothetical protein
MRKTLSVLLALLMFFCIAASAAESVPASSPEQALVDKLHEEYNVWVLFGEKAYDRAQFFNDSYSIHPAEESVSLLKVMLSTSYTLEALELLESELARYPQGFFSQFSKSLVINLVGSLHDLRSDEDVSGFCGNCGNTVEICLNVYKMDARAVHHEIWHAIEYWSQANYNVWDSLLPKGFEYTGSGLDSSGFDPEWFYREYSVKSEKEDRATVFEAYFLESPEWWEDHPHIAKKFALMRLLLDAGFGWVIQMEE